MQRRDVSASLFLVPVVVCLSVGLSYAQVCVNTLYAICPDCSNGPCYPSSGCAFRCPSPPPRVRASGPGFSTIFKDGELTVAQVFPNSPAQLSGIEVGDVVERVDGKSVPLCYGSLREQQEHAYTLKRNGLSFTVSVGSASVFDLIAQAIQQNLLVDARYPSRQIRVPQYPFLSGLITIDSKGQTIVEQVLPGSPADEAGIKAGDMISAVVDPMATSRTESTPEGADYRATFRLSVGRNGNARLVTLRLRSATHVLLDSLAASTKSSNTIVAVTQ